MKKLITLILILITSSAIASESKSSKEFSVKADTTKVVKWIENHRDDLLRASGCEILSRNGKTVKVKKKTVKGEFIFELKEADLISSTAVCFTAKMTKCYSGNLTSQFIRITVESKKGKTYITIETNASVDRSDILAIDIKIDLNKSIRGTRKLLVKEFKSDDNEDQN